LFSQLPMFAGLVFKKMTGGEAQTAVDLSQLRHALMMGVPLFVSFSLVSVGATLLGQQIGTRFRRALHRELAFLYFSHDTFYRLQLMTESIVDPDQIITADVTQMIRILWGGVNPPYESAILKFTAAFVLLGFAIRNALRLGGQVVTILSLALLLSTFLINWCISKPVEKITAAQEELEGRFRLQHMRLCIYAEHVALLRGTRFEAKLLEGLFAAVIIHQGVLVRAYYVLMGCVSFFGVSGMAFNTAICSIRLYTGELAAYDTSQLAQLLGTMDMLAGAFQVLPTMLPQIATAGGMAGRVIELYDTLTALNEAKAPPVELLDTPYRLGFELLTLHVPDRSMLVARDLRFVVERGVSTILSGESGCGKSSLLRCLAGLWDADCGIIYRSSSVVFLPQKPYFCVGTLRDQVLYPSGTSSDAEIIALLNTLQLGVLHERYGLDQIITWEDVLSGGEQQRLSFARALAARPSFAVLDESTSALDLASEQKCMRMMANAGITCLSVGHRPSVEKYHQRKIVLRRSPINREDVNLLEVGINHESVGEDAASSASEERWGCTAKLI